MKLQAKSKRAPTTITQVELTMAKLKHEATVEHAMKKDSARKTRKRINHHHHPDGADHGEAETQGHG